MLRIAGLLTVFWIWQAIAQVFFKYGSMAQSRWLPCFVLGNVFGASSIWFLMKLYSRLNPNLAMALGGGGAFLVVQCTLALVFASRPTSLHWLGYAMIGIGMGLATLNLAPKP
jgi:multidrug transporter EmrE-like cation transporter